MWKGKETLAAKRGWKTHVVITFERQLHLLMMEICFPALTTIMPCLKCNIPKEYYLK